MLIIKDETRDNFSIIIDGNYVALDSFFEQPYTLKRCLPMAPHGSVCDHRTHLCPLPGGRTRMLNQRTGCVGKVMHAWRFGFAWKEKGIVDFSKVLDEKSFFADEICGFDTAIHFCNRKSYISLELE